jgi:hypothetical protein
VEGRKEGRKEGSSAYIFMRIFDRTETSEERGILDATP